MRLHGILTIVALLLIAGGALPMLMGETMSLTGEHDGAMFGELLFTVGTDPYYVGDFKHTNIHESSLQLYGVMGGVEIPVALDDIDYENGRYALNYLLSLDTNQVLNLDGTYADGVFTDLSGNGNHGTPYNGATTGTGIVGDGMSFDGVDDYISISNDDDLNITGAISICFWVDLDRLDTVQHLMGYRGLSSGTDRAYAISYNTNEIWFDRSDSSGTRDYIKIPCTTTDYIFGCFTWNGTTDANSLNSYLNGMLSDTDNSLISDISTSTTDFSIGMRKQAGDAWSTDGTLDEIRIYNRALTPDEVSYLNDCVDVSNIEYPYGTEIYASYTYSDTFAPIGSDLFGLGVSLVGCVMLIVVVVGSTGRW